MKTRGERRENAFVGKKGKKGSLGDKANETEKTRFDDDVKRNERRNKTLPTLALGENERGTKGVKST